MAAATATNSKETSTQDVPKLVEFEALSFVDFALELLRRLPSKHVDCKYLSGTKIKSLKSTAEETNGVISGLEVARGFALLGRIASSKTLKEIFKVLDHACGIKGQNICDYETIIEGYLNMKNKDEVHVDACRLFFEQRIVAAINAELSNKIDAIYLESTLNDQNDRHVIKEINFLTDPIGTANKWKMDMEIKKATYGRIQKVIRNDLAPNWRTRMSLVVASDDSFHWKVHGDVQYSRAYFYSGFERNDGTKFGVNSIKAKCEFRTVDTADVRIVELFSFESESLIILIPLRKKLSSEFLKKVKADNLKTWITKIQTEAERKVGTIMLPLLSVNTATGLRSVFDNYPSIISSFFGTTNVFSTPRIFCPHKAEFSEIIGEKSDSIGVIFPLYEYFYKCKTVILIDNRPPLLRSDVLERKDPKPVKLVLVHDEKVYETESTFYQVKDDETTYVVGKVSFNESGLKEIKKTNPKHVKQPSVEKTHPKSLELQKTQDATVDEHGRGHQRHHSVGPSLPVTPKPKITQGNLEIPQNSVQEKSRDENSNFLAALPEWKPAGDYDFHPSYDHDDNETDNNPDLFPNFDVKIMEADMVVDTPFLFMVVSESDGGSTTKKLIHFVGRFTGVDEIVDSTILKSFQQPKKTV